MTSKDLKNMFPKSFKDTTSGKKSIFLVKLKASLLSPSEVLASSERAAILLFMKKRRVHRFNTIEVVGVKDEH